MGIRSLLRRRARSRPRSSSSSPSSPASPTASPAGLKGHFERVFRKFDSNGDGRISSSELATILESLGHPVTDEELAQMMSEADTDGDGFISLEEFLDLNVRAVDDAAALEDLRHAFSVFDLDRSGAISAEELARVLRGLGERTSLAECRRMIDQVDRDGDGLVSFEEFRVMMATGSNALALAPNI